MSVAVMVANGEIVGGPLLSGGSYRYLNFNNAGWQQASNNYYYETYSYNGWYIQNGSGYQNKPSSTFPASHQVRLGYSIKKSPNATQTYTTYDATAYKIDVAVATGHSSFGSVSGGGLALYGGSVTITATATTQGTGQSSSVSYAFDYWSPSADGASSTITSITADATYTAYFKQASWTRNANAGENGSVTKSPTWTGTANRYIVGNFTSTPTGSGSGSTGYVLDYWDLNGAPQTSGSGTISVNATTGVITIPQNYAQAVVVTARFRRNGSQLNISASPANGGSVSPASGNYHGFNTQVTVSASPNDGFTFSGWSISGGSINGNVVTMPASGNVSLVANFSEIPTGTLQVEISSPAHGSVRVQSVPARIDQTLTNASNNVTGRTSAYETFTLTATVIDTRLASWVGWFNSSDELYSSSQQITGVGLTENQITLVKAVFNVFALVILDSRVSAGGDYIAGNRAEVAENRVEIITASAPVTEPNVYFAGTIRIQAFPAFGWMFTGWVVDFLGGGTGSTSGGNFETPLNEIQDIPSVNQNAHITAVFSRVQVSVEIAWDVYPDGFQEDMAYLQLHNLDSSESSLSGEGTLIVRYGDRIRASAILADIPATRGYKFSGWYDRDGVFVSSESSYEFNVGNNNVYLKARYVARVARTLTIFIENDSNANVEISRTEILDWRPVASEEVLNVFEGESFSFRADTINSVIGSFVGWFGKMGTIEFFITNNLFHSVVIEELDVILIARFENLPLYDFNLRVSEGENYVPGNAAELADNNPFITPAPDVQPNLYINRELTWNLGDVAVGWEYIGQRWLSRITGEESSLSKPLPIDAPFPFTPQNDVAVTTCYQRVAVAIMALVDGIPSGLYEFTLTDVTTGLSTSTDTLNTRFGNDVTFSVNLVPNARGYRFIGWKRGTEIVSTNATYPFKAEHVGFSLTAVFEPADQRILTVSLRESVPGDVVKISGPGIVESRDVVSGESITAYDGEVFHLSVDVVNNDALRFFAGWFLGDSLLPNWDSLTCDVEVDGGNVALSGLFGARDTIEVNVFASDENTWRPDNSAEDADCSVSITNPSSPIITGTNQYLSGSFTVTATNGTGWRVKGWALFDELWNLLNSGTSMSISQTLTITQNTNFVFVFERVPVTVFGSAPGLPSNIYTLSITDTTTGVQSSSGQLTSRFGHGVSFRINLRAVDESRGYSFDGWFNGNTRLTDRENPVYTTTVGLDSIFVTAKFRVEIVLSAAFTASADNTGIVEFANRGGDGIEMDISGGSEITVLVQATEMFSIGYKNCHIAAFQQTNSIFDGWFEDLGANTDWDGTPLSTEPDLFFNVEKPRRFIALFVGSDDLTERYLAVVNRVNATKAVSNTVGRLSLSDGVSRYITTITRTQWEAVFGAVVAPYSSANLYFKIVGSHNITVLAEKIGSLDFHSWQKRVAPVATPVVWEEEFPTGTNGIAEVGHFSNNHAVIFADWGNPPKRTVTVRYATNMGSHMGGFTLSPKTVDFATGEMDSISDKYFDGDTVTLTVSSMLGYRFVRWASSVSGDASFEISTIGVITFVVSGDRTIYAVFMPDTDSIYLWQGSDVKMLMTYRTKRFQSAVPVNLKCARVYANRYPVVLSIFTASSPDEPSLVADVVREVKDQRGFQLPRIRREIFFELEVKGQDTIQEIAVSTSTMGVRGG